MTTMQPRGPDPGEYVLSHDDEELTRLERQAAVLAPATMMMLERAGILSGMRVLDLGTGLGDVAFLASELVGPEGIVLGLDRSTTTLDRARERAAVRGIDNVRFEEGDLNDWHSGEAFDAVVGRLILLYVPDPVAVLRQVSGFARPGAVVAFMEYDMPAVGTVPAGPEFDQARRWILEGFARSGHDPALGRRLPALLTEAGLDDVHATGTQEFFPPGSPVGPGMAAGVVRSLLPAIVANSVATADEVDVETLQSRLLEEVTRDRAVVAIPALIGGWGRTGGADPA